MSSFPNDPFYLFERTGDKDNPFKQYNEPKVIFEGKVILTEIPHKYNHVVVKDGTTVYGEVYSQGALSTSNVYFVDYDSGTVYFDLSHNGKQLTFSYTGTGYVTIPSTRVYTQTDNGVPTQNLQDMIDNYNQLNGTDLYNLFDPQTGHKHSGAAGDAPPIDSQYITYYDGMGTITNVNVALNNHWDQITANETKLGVFSDLIINVKDDRFSAKGDGSTDDTNAIQNAVNYVSNLGGGIVRVPPGTYKCSTINVPSNVIIEGFGDATVFTKSGGFLFNATGTLGTEIPLGANLTSGAVTITTTSAHGLAVGDLVLIKSQRNALSSDATDQWRLGFGTTNTSSCYFGEFVRVQSVISTVSFKITSGLLYPSYNMDKTSDSSSTARSNATIMKFNPVTKSIIRNLKITGTPASAINFQYAFECYVENVSFEAQGDSVFIAFKESLMCKGYKNRVYYDPSTSPAQIYSRNAYKCISSYLCGFEDCYGENGTQTFDFTFNDSSIPSTHCFVKNCETKGAINNSLTTHGGTFAALIENNNFIDNVSNGISIRSRSSVVSGNRLNGNPTSSYGICLYDGWARDCVISNNSLTGFTKAFDILDGTTSDEYFTWVGCVIEGNTINYCNIGLYLDRDASNIYSKNIGVQFKNNVMEYVSGNYAKLVYLTPYVNEVFIAGNVFVGTGGANAGVYGAANTTNIYMMGNSFRDAGTAFWFLQPTDTTVFPSGTNSIFIGDDNEVVSGTTLYSFEANVNLLGVPNHFGSFHPHADGTNLLGWSQRRWSAIYAVSGLITTSDANLKTDIQPETLGLDFVNQLQPKTFKFTEGESNRTHHGLIAQDVEQIINSLGISIDDFAILTKTPKVDDNGNVIPDEYVYGLRYSELIGILIKAIQELNNKIV